jgi:hypothetical protein
MSENALARPHIRRLGLQNFQPSKSAQTRNLTESVRLESTRKTQIQMLEIGESYDMRCMFTL